MQFGKSVGVDSIEMSWSYEVERFLRGAASYMRWFIANSVGSLVRINKMIIYYLHSIITRDKEGAQLLVVIGWLSRNSRQTTQIVSRSSEVRPYMQMLKRRRDDLCELASQSISCGFHEVTLGCMQAA